MQKQDIRHLKQLCRVISSKFRPGKVGDFMYVKNIEWLNRESKEAILNIINNRESLMCFSCPCFYNIGDMITSPLECLDADDIILCNEEESIIRRIDESFQYKIKGKLKDKANGIVDTFGFYLHIDEDKIPGDLKNGMYIQFITSRIDIW